MEPLTYEAVTRNPELVQALIDQSRRERAQAMHRLIIEPIKRLFGHHAPRTNLGHPRKASRAAA